MMVYQRYVYEEPLFIICLKMEDIVVGWAGESDEKFEHYITDETDHMYDFNCYEDYLEFNKSIFNEEDEDEIHYVMYEVFFPQYLLTCLYDYNMN